MDLIKKIKDSVNNYIDKQAIFRLEDKVKFINREREELRGWTDKELRLAGIAFKEDLKNGKALDDLLIPAFSVVCEVARRVMNQVPYDAQILGGIIIHMGKIAEMKAGEGKTLTETMPVYLNALSGKGVHIITTNDYLAERDAKWMGKMYDFLGISAGYVTSEMQNDQRKKSYALDVTYVTNQEIGFDYLRDNLVLTRSDRVLRQDFPLHFGIVDEIDSILIDESRTPLIIAQPIKEDRKYYDIFTQVISQMEEGADFVVDYRKKNVSITDVGLNKVEQLLGSAVFSKENPMFAFYLDVCLKARTLFEKDRDYIVIQDGRSANKAGVEIVDEFTGRVLPGRRFTDGVHQAIEAKEKVNVKESDRTTAAITFQNFFPMYEKLSGMSGTVMLAREEFYKVYNLEVVQIPTNRPIIRVDHSDLFFKTKAGKFMGLLKRVKRIYKIGQPILIGARNVETAHFVSELLNSNDLPHQLLTAKDHKAEAEKIVKAGRKGMITVATNMAGRGTDIILGNEVKELGLYVIGTERHESRRIDDQLVGRSGRQGEAGETVFMLSMEDEIMSCFGSERIIDVMEAIDIPEDEYISGVSLDKAFLRAQELVESKNYDSRVYLYKYDRVINFQRNEVYALRDQLLEAPNEFNDFLEQSVADVLDNIFALNDARLVSEKLKKIFFADVEAEELNTHFALEKNKIQAKRNLQEYFLKIAKEFRAKKEAYEAAQSLILQIIDDAWSEHLDLMEMLKEESSLLSYASEEPLLEFIKESRMLFAQMGQAIEEKLISSILRIINQKS